MDNRELGDANVTGASKDTFEHEKERGWLPSKQCSLTSGSQYELLNEANSNDRSKQRKHLICQAIVDTTKTYLSISGNAIVRRHNWVFRDPRWPSRQKGGAAQKGGISHDKNRETRRLQEENRYLKQILDYLHKSIILGKSTQHMELKPPEERKNDTLLIELTAKTKQIHSRFNELETELNNIHSTISNFTSMIAGDNRSEDRTQEKINKLTATGRKPRANPARTLEQREQSSKIDKDIEHITSEWLNMKEKEKELLASKQEMENKIKEYEHKGVVEHHSTKIAWEDENLEWEKKEAYREKKKADLQRRSSTIEEYIREDGNVSVEDLRDADRPTKLGEVYTELYENVFTEAFEELTKHDTITENDAFRILLKILMSSFQNCREMTWGRYEKLINVASSLDIEQGSSLSSAKIAVNDNVESGHSSAIGESNDDFEKDEEKHLKCTIDLNFDLMQAINGIWRTTTLELKEIAVETLYSVIETCLDMPFNIQPMTSKYLKRCIDLCWKMGVQEKPLHLDGFAEMDAYAGKKFDEDKFDAHARSGSHVAFVVWPTLYLYEGGPILAKGIAQCCSPVETENEESS